MIESFERESNGNSARSGKWEYVKAEIAKINQCVVERGAVLKVVLENDCNLVFKRRYLAFTLHID